ncbi:MAG: Efflux ABC transporter, ATP-binding protein [Candidatus Bipolaricaulis sibiricus]|uniref:Efflux ABC transporter, ATP-binding protein n=1 Tax=Bipolaricaulis sibiricus TaxID=2501609 RepID=A0A410FT63_BIPS1|nr:MAG: Efflux ABC transporter, ATP-binding protein [Candidatus Bipolaricaulis sibiricus]
MIHAEGLTRRFGPRTAVDRLTLDVPEGEILGLLGPNGAGKTTTVRMLACLLSPTSGRAHVAGYDIHEAAQRVRSSVGILTESPGFYKRLSLERNLRYFAELYGVPDPRSAVRRYLDRLGLWERRGDAVATLSKGLRQRLALARALVHEPKVLFLDEPTSGLDPESARDVRQFIGELASERRTVLLCTHNLPEAEELCARIAVLRTRLIALDRPEVLKQRLSGSRVTVGLANPRPEFASSLGLPCVRGVELGDGSLSVEVADPGRDIPAVVRRLVELGAEIRSVTRDERTLEDVYLELVGGADGAA